MLPHLRSTATSHVGDGLNADYRLQPIAPPPFQKPPRKARLTSSSHGLCYQAPFLTRANVPSHANTNGILQSGLLDVHEVPRSQIEWVEVPFTRLQAHR